MGQTQTSGSPGEPTMVRGWWRSVTTVTRAPRGERGGAGSVGVPLALVFLYLFVPVGYGCAQQPSSPVSYGYYYKGDLITLTPSERLVALHERGDVSGVARAQGLARDPLSDHQALRSRNVGLYRLPDSLRHTAPQEAVQQEIERIARESTEEVQPVFERGQSLLIPSDEIIVRFEDPTTLAEAQALFVSYAEAQGIAAVNEHRGNAFLVRIQNPANGRVYPVSRFLAGLGEIEYAEPNHIVVPLETRPVPSLPG